MAGFLTFPNKLRSIQAVAVPSPDGILHSGYRSSTIVQLTSALKCHHFLEYGDFIVIFGYLLVLGGFSIPKASHSASGAGNGSTPSDIFIFSHSSSGNVLSSAHSLQASKSRHCFLISKSGNGFGCFSTQLCVIISVLALHMRFCTKMLMQCDTCVQCAGFGKPDGK